MENNSGDVKNEILESDTDTFADSIPNVDRDIMLFEYHLYDKSLDSLKQAMLAVYVAMRQYGISIADVISLLTDTRKDNDIQGPVSCLMTHQFGINISEVPIMQSGVYIDLNIRGTACLALNTSGINLCKTLYVRDYGNYSYIPGYPAIKDDHKYSQVTLSEYTHTPNSYMSYNYTSTRNIMLKFLSENPEITFAYTDLDILYYDIETYNVSDHTAVPIVGSNESRLGMISVSHFSKHLEQPKLIIYYISYSSCNIDTIKSKFPAYDVSLVPCISEQLMAYKFIQYIGSIHRAHIVTGFNSNTSVHQSSSHIGYDLPFILNKHPGHLSITVCTIKCGNVPVKCISRIDELKYSYFVDMRVLLYNALSPGDKNRLESQKLNDYLILAGIHEKYTDHGSYSDLQRTLATRESDVTDIAVYCAYDSIALHELNVKYGAIQKVLAIGNMLQVPLSMILYTTQASCITAYLSRMYVARGYAIPYSAMESRVKYQGAYTFTDTDKQLSIIEQVADLDFTSLYPSIMIGYNVSPDTVDCNAMRGLPIVNYRVSDTVLGYSDREVQFVSKDARIGMIPELLIGYMNKRGSIKTRMNIVPRGSQEYTLLDMEQYAIKIVMNSIYGILGSNSIFYNLDSAVTITYHARMATMATHQWYKSKYGYDPLLIDTDSIMGTFANERDISELQQYMSTCGSTLTLAHEDTFKVYMASRARKSYIAIDSSDRLIVKGVSWSLYTNPGKTLIQGLFRSLLIDKPSNIAGYIRNAVSAMYRDIQAILKCSDWRDKLYTYACIIKLHGSSNVAVSLYERYGAIADRVPTVPIYGESRHVADNVRMLSDPAISPISIDIVKLLSRFASSIFKLTVKIQFNSDPAYSDNLVHYRTETWTEHGIIQDRDLSLPVSDFTALFYNNGKLLPVTNTSIHEVFIPDREYRLFLDLDDCEYDIMSSILGCISGMLSHNISWVHTVGRSTSFHCISNIRMDLPSMVNLLTCVKLIYPRYAKYIDMGPYAPGKSLRVPHTCKISISAGTIDKHNVHNIVKVGSAVFARYLISNLQGTESINTYRFSNIMPYSMNDASIGAISDDLMGRIQARLSIEIPGISVTRSSASYLVAGIVDTCIICNKAHNRASYYIMYTEPKIILKCWGSQDSRVYILDNPECTRALSPIEANRVALMNMIPGLPDDRSIGAIHSDGDISVEVPSNRAIFIRSAMGTGKTNLLSRYLDTLPADATVLMMSFRKTFADNMSTRLGLVNYQDIKGPIDQLVYKRVLIQIDSLIRYRALEPCDVLVLDEAVSIIEQLTTPLCYSSTAMYQVFVNLIRSSKKVILMDGLLSAKIVSILNDIMGTTCDYAFIDNTYIPSIREMPLIISHSNKSVLSAIIHDVNEQLAAKPDSKISLYITTKKGVSTVYDTLASLYRDKRILVIDSDDLAVYGDVPSITLKTKYMCAPESIFTDYDIFIHTSSLSAGISIERTQVDLSIGYYHNMTCSPLAFIQGLFRCRNVVTRKLYYMPGRSATELSSPCDIYMNIIKQRYSNMPIVDMQLLADTLVSDFKYNRDSIFMHYLRQSGIHVSDVIILENRSPSDLIINSKYTVFDVHADGIPIDATDRELYSKFSIQKYIDSDYHHLITYKTQGIFSMLEFLELSKMDISDVYQLQPEEFKRLYDTRFSRIRLHNLLGSFGVSNIIDIPDSAIVEQRDNSEQAIKAVVDASQIASRSVNPIKAAQSNEAVDLVRILSKLEWPMTKEAMESYITSNMPKLAGRTFSTKINKIINHINYELQSKRCVINGTRVTVYSLVEM